MAPKKTHPRSRPGLQVLERAFTVLGLFSVEHPEWSMTEIARACELPIPTAHRIVSALRAHGFLARDEATKRLRLGPAAFRLGELARGVMDIQSIAKPVLRDLAQQTGETALLTVLDPSRERSVCLDRVESTQPLRLAVEPGRHLPLHAGASQKVLLAHLPPEDIERLLNGPLTKVGRGTITDRKLLRDDLKEIRGRGYAVSFEETDQGAWGIAVPVLDSAGRIVAGIGLAAPSARTTQRAMRQHLRQLRAAVEEISSLLGVVSSHRQANA